MYDRFTSPWVPLPPETYKPGRVPTLAKWAELKSRRVFESELFGDLQRHPWVGVRQVSSRLGSANLYGSRAAAVDQDLRRLPYGQRLQNPGSGIFPLIVGQETGTGPGPWWGYSRREDVEGRQGMVDKDRQHWNDTVEHGVKKAIREGGRVRNAAAYLHGPNA